MTQTNGSARLIIFVPHFGKFVAGVAHTTTSSAQIYRRFQCCYSCKQKLVKTVWMVSWRKPFSLVYFKSKQHSELRSHIYFTKSIPVILLTTKDNSHSWRFNAVIFFLCVQVFQVCIHCIVVNVHVEQPLQKERKSKEWHDFTILFVSVCTGTRQQNLWHYDPTRIENESMWFLS